MTSSAGRDDAAMLRNLKGLFRDSMIRNLNVLRNENTKSQLRATLLSVEIEKRGEKKFGHKGNKKRVLVANN